MSALDNLVQSKAYKNFMAKLYGWGAAVVIFGALFKIQHWPGATPMLIIGMSTEVLIFFMSAKSFYSTDVFLYGRPCPLMDRIVEYLVQGFFKLFAVHQGLHKSKLLV